MYSVLISVTVALTYLLVSVSAEAAISKKERSALLDLYNGTSGTSWKASTNWTGDVGGECTWFGVSCNSGQSAVISINLNSNQLTGTIPSSIGDLTDLVKLNLSANQMTGTIPSSLSNLVSLEELDLSGNKLTGPIPSLWGARDSLLVLRLSSNQLSGSIPSSIGALTKLQKIYLSSNKLGGWLPPEVGSLTALQELYLSNNQLTGIIPSEIGSLSSLLVLSLSGNQLFGSLPPSLGNLTNLENLYLLSNRLSDEIPPELGSLRNLQAMNLSSNGLSGMIPATLGNLMNLMHLDLSANQLSGMIPSSLGSLTKLMLLNLYANQLSGSIPSSLGNLTNLEMLDLSANRLSGIIPSSLGMLSHLNGLSVAYNALDAKDSALRSFLNLMELGWENTETVSPTSVSVVAKSDLSIVVSWTPIGYTGGIGEYEVWSGGTSGGPYALSGWTLNKSASSFVLSGLSPGTYYIVVNATTNANAHNKNIVSSEFSAEVSVTLGPRIALNLVLSSGGASSAVTLGNGGTTQAGYATITSNSGVTPYGTAVFSYRQNGLTVCEAGVAASTPTNSALIFVDYRTGVTVPGSIGKIDISTGFAAVNVGTGTATISAALRDLDGRIITAGAGSISMGAHVAKYVNQLSDMLSGFSIPSTFPVSTRFGTLELSSNQPLSIVALRLTTNQRGDTLITSTPIVDRTAQLTSTPLYFPQLVDGGGYSSMVILINTSSAMEFGTMDLYANDGLPLTVKQVDGHSSASFTYSIPAGGAYVLQTDASPTASSAGWMKITPGAGSSTPTGGAIFQYSQGGVLVTESAVASATPTTHARVFVDTSNGHDTGLALGNPGNGLVNITLAGFQLDGSTQAGAGQGPLALVANGHAALFVDQQIAALPADFRGVLDIASDSPFVALTLRSLVNERGDFLLTTFPIADMNTSAPSPIIIPQFADGGGFTTEFILLNAGPSTVATISFFGDTGTAVAISLNR